MKINTFSDWFLLSYFTTAISFCVINTIFAIKKYQNEFIDNFDRSAHRLFIRSALWPMFTIFTIVYGAHIIITQIKDKRKNNNVNVFNVETSAIINWSMTSDADLLNIRKITTCTLDRLRDICTNFRNNMYHEASDLGHNTSYQKYYKDWLKSQTLLVNAEVIKSMAESEADNELLRRNLYIDPDNQITFNTLLNIDATYNALRQFADKAKSDEANSIKPNN